MKDIHDASLKAPILIVDDNPANVLLLERILGEGGYRNVHTTTDPCLGATEVPQRLASGRGRVRPDRKRMIWTIAESFVDESRERKISDKLVIVVRPEDAQKFQVNLWEIKDH